MEMAMTTAMRIERLSIVGQVWPAAMRPTFAGIAMTVLPVPVLYPVLNN
jgi:hypothetical protein